MGSPISLIRAYMKKKTGDAINDGGQFQSFPSDGHVVYLKMINMNRNLIVPSLAMFCPLKRLPAVYTKCVP